MPTNTRSYYVNQGLFVKPDGSSDPYTFVHGVQEGSDSTSIPKTDINEWGQINVYERIEDTPEVSLDFTRVLDGCAPLYLLATEGAAAASLTGRQDREAIMAIVTYNSSVDYIEDSNNPVKIVEFSGVQVNSISYSFTTDGSFTETLNFTGDDKVWTDGVNPKFGTLPADPTSGGTDQPCALDPSCLGGVQQKENLVFDSGVTYQTLLPAGIAGITANGINPTTGGECPDVPIQSIEISVDLNREKIPALGCKGDYVKLSNFPVDVTVTITALTQDGDGIDIRANGGSYGDCNDLNTPNERFRVVTDSGLVIDCGDRLQLDEVNTTWGSADGGNAETTYTYVGKSVMSVFHTNDPSSIVYAGNP